MALKFSSVSYSVKELFSDPFRFSIPSFQRPYAWAKVEAARLLEDLLLAVEEDKASNGEGDGHFLGSIVLLCEAGECASQHTRWVNHNRPQNFQIIDGQQRVVTVVILLCVLRDILGEHDKDSASTIQSMFMVQDEAEQARLVMNGGEGKFLNKFVLRRGASEDMPACDRLSVAQENMLVVREYFATELSNMDSGQLPFLLNMIQNDCGFSVVTTRTIDRAFRVFATLNDRGRKLSNSDILKAEILGQISAGDDMACQVVWEDIRARLGVKFEDLFSHIRVIYGREKVPIIHGIRSIIAEAGGALSFIETVLTPMADAYDYILSTGKPATGFDNNIAFAERTTRALTHLHWLRENGWVPVAMRWICLLKDEPEQLADFLEELERFSYSLLVIGLGGRKRQNRYKSILSETSADNLFHPAVSPMTFKREDQRRILYNLRNIYGRDQYACKLVLLLLSEELAGQDERLDRSILTVEHVLPVNPDRDSDWRKLFPDPEELEQCIVCLGNLILISADQNREARNFEYEQKLQIYFEDHHLALPSLTYQLQDIGEWTPKIVRAREFLLIQILRQKWNLNIVSNKNAAGFQDDADTAYDEAGAYVI